MKKSLFFVFIVFIVNTTVVANTTMSIHFFSEGFREELEYQSLISDVIAGATEFLKSELDSYHRRFAFLPHFIASRDSGISWPDVKNETALGVAVTKQSWPYPAFQDKNKLEYMKQLAGQVSSSITDNDFFVVVLNDENVSECRSNGVVFLRRSHPANMVFQLIHELGHQIAELADAYRAFGPVGAGINAMLAINIAGREQVGNLPWQALIPENVPVPTSNIPYFYGEDQEYMFFIPEESYLEEVGAFTENGNLIIPSPFSIMAVRDYGLVLNATGEVVVTGGNPLQFNAVEKHAWLIQALARTNFVRRQYQTETTVGLDLLPAPDGYEIKWFFNGRYISWIDDKREVNIQDIAWILEMNGIDAEQPLQVEAVIVDKYAQGYLVYNPYNLEWASEPHKAAYYALFRGEPEQFYQKELIWVLQ
ncbi:MAG: M64 family metallopeptidase [bacterium]|nr:M64 family metallopeptidase [bacterium]